MVAQTGYVDIVGPASVSIEDALADALRRMRLLAANAGTDDFYENWSREVLDRRPLIVVAAVMEGQAFTWVVEPGIGSDSNHSGVLHAANTHLARGNDRPVLDLGHAEVETDALLVKTLRSIVDEVSWLVRGNTGEFLTDRD